MMYLRGIPGTGTFIQLNPIPPLKSLPLGVSKRRDNEKDWKRSVILYTRAFSFSSFLAGTGLPSLLLDFY